MRGAGLAPASISPQRFTTSGTLGNVNLKCLRHISDERNAPVLVGFQQSPLVFQASKQALIGRAPDAELPF